MKCAWATVVRASFIVWMVSAVALMGSSALACGCPTPVAAFASADTVFVGRAFSSFDLPFVEDRILLVEVERTLKGHVTSPLLIRTSRGNCGLYGLLPSAPMLIFAHSTIPFVVQRTGICSGTTTDLSDFLSGRLGLGSAPLRLEWLGLLFVVSSVVMLLLHRRRSLRTSPSTSVQPTRT